MEVFLTEAEIIEPEAEGWEEMAELEEAEESEGMAVMAEAEAPAEMVALAAEGEPLLE